MEEILGTVAGSAARLRADDDPEESKIAASFIGSILSCAGFFGDPPLEWVRDQRSMVSPGFYRFYLRPEDGGRIIVKKALNAWEIAEWLIVSMKNGKYEMLSCPGAPAGRMGEEPCAALDPTTWAGDLNQLVRWSLGLRGKIADSLEGSLFTKDENGMINFAVFGETASILSRIGMSFQGHCPWMFGLHIVKTLKAAGRLPFIPKRFS